MCPRYNALKICQNRLLEKIESLESKLTLINETKDFSESNFKPLILKLNLKVMMGKDE